MVKDETISTVFIDLHKIMYAGSDDKEGYLENEFLSNVLSKCLQMKRDSYQHMVRVG